MLLHIHKEKTDSLNLIDVADKFAWKENRREIFGMFNENDVKPKVEYRNNWVRLIDILYTHALLLKRANLS